MLGEGVDSAALLLTVSSQPPGVPPAIRCTRSGVRGACRRSLTAAVDDVMELWALLCMD